nr:YjcQ family protein [uncultured Mitsuokella sp.]
MANFKLICQILTLLDKCLDHDDPDWSKLSAEHFKVTEKRFTHIMLMLYEAATSTASSRFPWAVMHMISSR